MQTKKTKNLLPKPEPKLKKSPVVEGTPKKRMFIVRMRLKRC